MRLSLNIKKTIIAVFDVLLAVYLQQLFEVVCAIGLMLHQCLIHLSSCGGVILI